MQQLWNPKKLLHFFFVVLIQRRASKTITIHNAFMQLTSLISKSSGRFIKDHTLREKYEKYIISRSLDYQFDAPQSDMNGSTKVWKYIR